MTSNLCVEGIILKQRTNYQSYIKIKMVYKDQFFRVSQPYFSLQSFI